MGSVLFLFGPLEGGEFRAVEVFEVGFVGAGGVVGADVLPWAVAKDFLAKCGEGWIVFSEFGTSVDVVVDIVVFAVGVKPRLDCFCPVFCMVAAGVGVLPFASSERGSVCGLKALVEGGVDTVECDEVDGMGELVDEDGFGIVRVAFEVEDVFFGTRDRGAAAAGAEAAGAGVPVFGGGEVGVFRDVGGALRGSHDGEAYFVLRECFEEIRTVADHAFDDECDFGECSIVDFARGDDGEGTNEEVFLIEGREVEFFAKGITNRLRGMQREGGEEER